LKQCKSWLDCENINGTHNIHSRDLDLLLKILNVCGESSFRDVAGTSSQISILHLLNTGTEYASQLRTTTEPQYDTKFKKHHKQATYRQGKFHADWPLLTVFVELNRLYHVAYTGLEEHKIVYIHIHIPILMWSVARQTHSWTLIPFNWPQ
jgi:hypothetical protein